MKLFKAKSIFFWRKKEIPKSVVEEQIKSFIKYAPLIRKIMRGQDVGTNFDEKITEELYDFFKNWNGSFDSDFAISDPSFDEQGNIVVKDDRLEATPLSVMNELETIPNPISMEGLDEKIETLKDKSKLTSQEFASNQIKGLIKRLENRKKYSNQGAFFSAFPNTSDAKINTLLKKYKLVVKTSDLFVPTFPKEAVDIMKKYTEETQKLCGENPVFYVIAEEQDFKKKDEKLDPILLAQSPFGFYWQILGAWDKEMLLLSEL